MKIVLRLLSFLRSYLGEMALAVLLGSGVVAAGIGLLGTSAWLLATAALHPSVGELQVAIVGVRFFGLSRGVLRYLERLVSHSVNFRLLKKFRVWFYRNIEPLSPAGLVDARGGDLLARSIGDIESLENFYVRAVSPPLVLLIVTAGMSWFVSTYTPLAGLILAAGLILGGASAAGLSFSMSRGFGRRAAAERAKTSAALLDGIQGLGDLVAFGQEARASDRLHAASRGLEESLKRLAQAGAAGSMLSALTGSLTLWVILLVAIPLVRSGSLDGVSLAVLALLTLASFEAAAPLSTAARHLEDSIQSAERLFQIADQRPEVVPPLRPLPLPTHLDLHIQGLSFRYEPGAAPVLLDFNLELPHRKRVGVIGPSGAGKTSLANLLLRFWDCPPGAIWLGGQDLREFDPDEVRQVIGLVPQATYLFSGTLRQNLLLARPEVSDKELSSVLEKTLLDRLVSRLPGGLDTWIGSQGEQLSGGERQRVALARALIQNPDVLILDEPTAGLDTQAAQGLMEVLRETSTSRAMILITHDLAGLEWLDEILVLVEGKVVERGTPAELAKAGGWYAQGLELRKRVLGGGEL